MYVCMYVNHLRHTLNMGYSGACNVRQKCSIYREHVLYAAYTNVIFVCPLAHLTPPELQPA